MYICRLSDFFTDESGRQSMSRLLMFLSFFPASYVVIYTCDAETLAWYMGAYAGSYVGGKFADRAPKGSIDRASDSNSDTDWNESESVAIRQREIRRSNKSSGSDKRPKR